MGARRPRTTITANPVLIGAVTVLVVSVAVFLAYNANNGLPFVPRQIVHIQMRDAEQLFKHAAVREGGQQIGVVNQIKPIRLPDQTVGAELTVQIDRHYGGLPIDSTVALRPVSALGELNVEITRGSSHRSIADNGTIPLSQTHQEVALDQVLSIFDQPTRTASRVNFLEFGNATAGRGPDLNTLLQRLPALTRYLTPVARNLSSPATALGQFFPQLDTTARTIAPVSRTFAHVFSTMANTFAAVDANPAALQQTVAKNPPTLAAGISSLRAEIPFLVDSAALGRALTAPTAALRGALPVLNSAVAVGTRVISRTPTLYSNLQRAMTALKDLAQAPTTNASLRGLTATVATLQPQLRYLGPYVTVCNFWNFLWTFAADVQSGPGDGGQVIRSELNQANGATDNYASQESPFPANGATNGYPGQVPEYLHAQPYGAAVTTKGAADCESGQRGYIDRTSVPEAQGTKYIHVINDPHNPVGYPAGPNYLYKDEHGVWHGFTPSHVPPGETFTREPGGTAAQMEPALQHANPAAG